MPRHLAFTAKPVSLEGMKRKPAKVSPEDAELFREAIGEVRRIETEAAADDRPRPPPEPKRLKIDESAARLARFLKTSVDLMSILARACGHRHLRDFTLDDLVTWKEDMVRLSGVPFGGIAPAAH